jgi:large subunit ribosomal protein L10
MRSEKKYLITEVEGHLKKSDYVYLANYEKVTVENVALLRKKLAAEGAEFHVVKNSSLRVAAKGLAMPELDQWLRGQTAIVVGGKNPTGVAKVLKDFFKETQKVEIKGGVFEAKAVDAKVVGQLADVPPMNVLKSQFLGLLKIKPQQLAALIQAYADKKAKEAPAAA